VGSLGSEHLTSVRMEDCVMISVKRTDDFARFWGVELVPWVGASVFEVLSLLMIDIAGVLGMLE
jgi:hypothetical protein